MNRPILQLIIFLLVIVFFTLVLLRFNSSYYIRKELSPESVDMALSSTSIPIISAQITQYRFFGNNSEMNLYYLIGTVKANLAEGKYDKAENTLRNLLLFFPDNKTVLSLLGGVLYSSGNYEQSQRMFTLIAQNDPDDPLAKENVGLALEKQQKYNEAIEEFLQASLLRPNSASMYLHLAGLYSIVGNKKLAIYNFAKTYEIIGVNILPLSFDPAFDNIRNMPEFISIIRDVESTIRKQENTASDKNILTN